ncbi:HAMP domain-containing histidine kinase, partial [Candidatus Curtissbacteria bacterium]|nr:HAMP domain-containing histidine kinase [Candidatus Curtissbacteria bacterium]
EAGKIVDIPEEFEVAKCIKNLIAMQTGIAKQKNITLSFSEGNAGSVKLYLDLKLFSQVVLNVLSNALKYSETKGDVEIGLDREGKTIQISVVDDGIGIPEKEIGMVFDKFFRASNAAKHAEEGTGLGLYVVKSYVQRWGGTVVIDSTEGHGTRVIINLPIKSR